MAEPIRLREPVDERLSRARAAAASVVDPEVPVLTIEDLGVLRDVRLDGEAVEIVITPTYSGCPAMDMIALEVDLALAKAGFAHRRVTLSLSPAWTTDWMSEAGKEKLRAYGIAPPQGRAKGRGRCLASRISRARIAARAKPCGFRNSGPPPARRCGVAKAAASRLITSSASEE